MPLTAAKRPPAVEGACQPVNGESLQASESASRHLLPAIGPVLPASLPLRLLSFTLPIKECDPMLAWTQTATAKVLWHRRAGVVADDPVDPGQRSDGRA